MKEISHGRSFVTMPDGTQQLLGYWKTEWQAGPGTPLSDVRQAFDQALTVLNKVDEAGREEQRARLNGKPLQDRFEWQTRARVELAKTRSEILARSRAKASAALAAHEHAMASLTPYDYGHDPVDAGRRQELRTVLRGLSTKEREAALKADPVMRRAALEQPPVASGLHPDRWQQIWSAELRDRHGDRLQELAALREAAETTLRMAAAGDALVDASVSETDLMACGPTG